MLFKEIPPAVVPTRSTGVMKMIPVPPAMVHALHADQQETSGRLAAKTAAPNNPPRAQPMLAPNTTGPSTSLTRVGDEDGDEDRCRGRARRGGAKRDGRSRQFCENFM